ncbi:RNA-guided endonuclease InsQ/TnpB family protein [Paenibacillus beijingensis]|uniref:Transposase n=1 Tax=Paenibacillus beijingensis TaxID=1126833 RepID=A0A0D5NK87_9BACL|nr:RNA-guided endonuclease TnpB family protein [Paenibacillus beijingensis]AJY75422.1 transposase [Paenibacillus beijingensis]
MQMTITAKIKINPTSEQIELLRNTLHAYRTGCNYVSALVFETKQLAQAKLHNITYERLRSCFSLRSQMAQSVMKTVIARYQSLKSNGHDWTKVQFRKPEYDLVWNRDYSLIQGLFSINTLGGRVKVPFETKGMEQYFDGTWSFGTAKLVNKYGKFYLHIPMTKEIPTASEHTISQVAGVDMGIHFVAVSYDSQGKSLFFNGRLIKNKRSIYKHMRKQLQQLGTASARRKLKRIGQRENRWMSDVNHQVSKALVERYGANTLFVVEDLSGVRQVTERVRVKNRYETVSWAFYQLRQMIEYKALMAGSRMIAVDPRFTSQTCPKCGHTEKGNRNKKKHTFCCKTCGYQSNDDRIGAMNLQRKGIEYIVEVTAQA